MSLNTEDTSRKRKFSANHHNADNKPGKRAKFERQSRQRAARFIASQSPSKALYNGELDVEKFIRAREFEIRALEQGMLHSKGALTERAFQQVPKELRRRTASHNVKRVPKRLRARARREMIEDNTPSVTARKRKPTRHMRLRIETAKRLRALGAKRKQSEKANDMNQNNSNSAPQTDSSHVVPTTGIASRPAKVKHAILTTASTSNSKFRKRQIHKSWLPTHLFHAKRAHMTHPKEPLWRFAVPLTPTAKGYRTTHRAANERGAVAWDMSYMSTIALAGRQQSLIGVLKALGAGPATGVNLRSGAYRTWLLGNSAWEGNAFTRERPHNVIAPLSVIWSSRGANSGGQTAAENVTRQLFVRVHPSAFRQLWEELVCLAKMARPQVTVEDVRFEIGSIEITGPGATEALLGALKPSPSKSYGEGDTVTDVGTLWQSLSGLTNPSLLPSNAVLGFDVQDPRLRFPPRTTESLNTTEGYNRLLETCAAWPVDAMRQSQALFDRRLRFTASSTLPSQKSISRRRSNAVPGQYPEPLATDPQIPALLYCSQKAPHQGKWTLLLPWKCVQPVWYSIIYYPLSTGGQPRFGGLQELRQLAFQHGEPWFPGDFPATKAGWDWEITERSHREGGWKRKPKSKRINWDAVRIGSVKKGEIGAGWACDWKRISQSADELHTMEMASSEARNNGRDEDTSAAANKSNTLGLTQIGTTQARRSLQSAWESLRLDPSLAKTLATIKITLVLRGVPQPCARIYRLPPDDGPSNANLRNRWLKVLASTRTQADKNRALNRLSKPVPPQTSPLNDLFTPTAPQHISRQQRLARSLLEPPQPAHPIDLPCPEEEDLIGFVTAGNFNLGEGHGTGVGSVLWNKVLEPIAADRDQHPSAPRREQFLCIVRNSGCNVARLARWELIGP